MFFIGVFGIGNKNKSLCNVSFKCTACINEKFSLVELSQSFDIFLYRFLNFPKSISLFVDNVKVFIR